MGGRAKAAETPQIVLGEAAIVLAQQTAEERDMRLREAFGISAGEARDAVANGTRSIAVAVIGLLADPAPPEPLGDIVTAHWDDARAQLLALLEAPPQADAGLASDAETVGGDE